MEVTFRTSPVGTLTWWRRWPCWAPRAACAWALVYGCVLAGVGASGGALYGVPYLPWAAATILLTGSAVAAPVWLIAPTLAAYGTGGWVFALLAMSGVVKPPSRPPTTSSSAPP